MSSSSSSLLPSLISSQPLPSNVPTSSSFSTHPSVSISISDPVPIHSLSSFYTPPPNPVLKSNSHPPIYSFTSSFTKPPSHPLPSSHSFYHPFSSWIPSLLSQKEAEWSSKWMDHWRGIIGEFLGSLLLIYVAVGTSILPLLSPSQSSVSILILGSLAIGFSVVVLVFALVEISGAHINPAVTLSLAVVRAFPWSIGIGYVIAQFLGGLSGAALMLGTVGTQAFDNQEPKTNVFLLNPGQTFLMEFVFSCFFIFTVLSTGVDTRGSVPRQHLAAIPIGLAVFVGLSLSGPLAPIALNPLRFLSPFILSGSSEFLKDRLWVSIVGPFAAALVMGIFYKVIFMSRKAIPSVPLASSSSSPSSCSSSCSCSSFSSSTTTTTSTTDTTSIFYSPTSVLISGNTLSMSAPSSN